MNKHESLGAVHTHTHTHTIHLWKRKARTGNQCNGGICLLDRELLFIKKKISKVSEHKLRINQSL